MWPEIKRKLFHLLGMIYVLGLIYLPRRTYLIVLGTALFLNLIVEMSRLKIPSFSDWFNKKFGGLLRVEERTHLSGTFWMLAGVTLTVALVEPVPLATTAILYLLLGDGIASLVGMRVGGPKWPGSNKTLSGSFACFMVCFFVGSIILRSAYYGWGGIVIGALVATIVERGILRLNDNFTIPVFSSWALLACYGFGRIG